MQTQTVVVRVGPDDWREAREVRLRALVDAPGAFAASYAREAAFGEATWRERLASGAWFLARDPDGATVGLAVGVPEPDVDDARMLVAMWVAQPRRRTRTADALVGAVAGWARGEGAGTLTLWVVDGNDRARRTYERLGSTPDGTRGPMPSAPHRLESRLRRPLRD